MKRRRSWFVVAVSLAGVVGAGQLESALAGGAPNAKMRSPCSTA
jgi:hypothetical protein